MRAKVVFSGVMAVLSLVVLPGMARAGLATQLLFVEDPPVVNQLEDEDFENINSSDSKLDVGEQLYGVWAVQKVNRLAVGGGSSLPGSGTDWFTVVFAMQVVAKTTQPDGNYVFGFGPVSSDSVFSSLTGGKSRSNSNTIAMVFSDPDGLSISPAVGDVGGTLLWELGFATPSYDTSDNVDLGIDTLTYFWVAESLSDDFSASPLALGYIASLDVLVTTANGLPLIPHNWLSFVGNQVRDLKFPNVSTPVQLHGSDEGRIGPTGLPLKTDTDIYVKPTPEPSPIVALAGLGLAVMVRAYNRRRAHA